MWGWQRFCTWMKMATLFFEKKVFSIMLNCIHFIPGGIKNPVWRNTRVKRSRFCMQQVSTYVCQIPRNRNGGKRSPDLSPRNPVLLTVGGTCWSIPTTELKSYWKPSRLWASGDRGCPHLLTPPTLGGCLQPPDQRGRSGAFGMNPTEFKVIFFAFLFST